MQKPKTTLTVMLEIFSWDRLSTGAITTVCGWKEAHGLHFHLWSCASSQAGTPSRRVQGEGTGNISVWAARLLPASSPPCLYIMGCISWLVVRTIIIVEQNILCICLSTGMYVGHRYTIYTKANLHLY